MDADTTDGTQLSVYLTTKSVFSIFSFENLILPNFQFNFQKLSIIKNGINFQFTLTSPKFKD